MDPGEIERFIAATREYVRRHHFGDFCRDAQLTGHDANRLWSELKLLSVSLERLGPRLMCKLLATPSTEEIAGASKA